MSGPLPTTPAQAWHSERSTAITWLVGALSLWVGGDDAPVRSGSLAISVNGISIEEGGPATSRSRSRFLPWTDITQIEPRGTRTAVAAIHLRTGEQVQLGVHHLPRRRAADASIDRAALLVRAYDQARREGRTFEGLRGD